MNFLNRKMFQTGGSANQYFYVDSLGNKQFLDENKLRSDLRATQTDVLSALIQNPDVTYSPATQELFRQVVAERQAPISSLDPSMFEFGEFLPDFISPKAGLKQTGSFVTDVGKTFAETGINLGRYLGQAFSERKPGQAPFEPIDFFPSERFPFDPSTRSGQRRFQDENIDKSGLLREGFTNEELDRVLGRSVIDFSEDIAELEKEPVVIEETEEDVVEQAPSIPTPITGGETLGQVGAPGSVGYEEMMGRKLAFEESMIGKDEFGEPIDRPDFTSQLPSPDRTEPVDLPPSVKTEIESALLEITPENTVVDLDTDIKPDMAFEKPEIDLTNVDTEITIDDLNRAEVPENYKKEVSGVFASDRFLDFVRNVGGELARTGQLGEGLASGAAKAAEERAARDLLEEEASRELKKAKELLDYEAEITGDDVVKMKPGETVDFVNEVKKDITDFEGGLAATGFTDYAIEIIEEAQAAGVKVGGFAGLARKMIDKGFAFVGMGKDFEDLSVDSKVEALVKVVRQKNLQAILGESGRTISDKDRQIILEVFGELSAFEDPSISLGKLKESRRGLAQANQERKARIQTNLPFLAKYGVDGTTFYTQQLPSLQRILGIDPLASQSAIARAQFGGDAGVNTQNVIDTTL